MSAQPAEALLDLIWVDGTIEPHARLRVYRNNILSRLTETLAAIFPVVRRLVDRRFFDYAAETFIRDNLPAHSRLGEYGEAFPLFLATFEPSAHIKYLADVGRLEWALSQARRTAEVRQPVPIGVLSSQTEDPSSLRLIIDTSVEFVASAYPIDRIWNAHQDENSLFLGLTLEMRSAHLQVSNAATLAIVNLPPDTWEFRCRLAKGDTLGSACVAAQDVASDFNLTSALARLFIERLVVGIGPVTKE